VVIGIGLPSSFKVRATNARVEQTGQCLGNQNWTQVVRDALDVSGRIHHFSETLVGDGRQARGYAVEQSA
jgi:hypothetical protein